MSYAVKPLDVIVMMCRYEVKTISETVSEPIELYVPTMPFPLQMSGI